MLWEHWKEFMGEFLSTPSARRATWRTIWDCLPKLFLSTPSARRATKWFWQRNAEYFYFYPRPPRGGRLASRHFPLLHTKISIHALREEGDARIWVLEHLGEISIHALREEGDSKNRDKISIFL